MSPRTMTVAMLLAAALLPPGAARAGGTGTRADALSVADFGCVGDGIADDGPCLQAAFDAASAQQRGIYLPPPRVAYRTRRELWLRHAYGIRVFGENPWTTKILFDLPSGATGLWVYNCYGVTFENLQLRGPATAVLDAVVNVQGDSTDPQYGRRPPGSNRFTNLRIVGGDAYSEYGVRYTIARASKDWNNDLSIWTGVDVAKARTAGVAIEHANSKSHQFHDCKFLYIGRGMPSLTRGAPGGWDAYPGDLGYAIWLKSGSFHWHGGYMGVVKGAYFRVDTPPVDGLVIRDGDFESGARIVDVSSNGSMPFHLVYEGNRYSAAFTNAPGAASERDSQVIRVASAVVASIRSNFFGESGQKGITKLAFTNDHPGFIEVVGNAFESVGAAEVPDLVTANPAQELDVHGNTFRASGPYRVVRRSASGIAGASAQGGLRAAPGSTLRGTVTFAGSATRQEIAFGEPGAGGPGADYFVAAGPAHDVAGGPPPGALRLARVAKSARAITLELEEPPGPGASVSFDWILVR